MLKILAAVALAALLTACGGGSEPIEQHQVSTIPVDCGGGIACK
jgi:hypothetical protein